MWVMRDRQFLGVELTIPRCPPDRDTALGLSGSLRRRTLLGRTLCKCVPSLLRGRDAGPMFRRHGPPCRGLLGRRLLRRDARSLRGCRGEPILDSYEMSNSPLQSGDRACVVHAETVPGSLTLISGFSSRLNATDRNEHGD